MPRTRVGAEGASHAPAWGWRVLALLLGPLGCGPAVPTAADRAEADRIFAERCANCHGPQGRGDGPAGRTLDPPPRDLTDPAFLRARTDEALARAIVAGGSAVGRSPAMPGNPDLADRPAVVRALVERLRAHGPPGGRAPRASAHR